MTTREKRLASGAVPVAVSLDFGSPLGEIREKIVAPSVVSWPLPKMLGFDSVLFL